jgi:hypothetical protein
MSIHEHLPHREEGTEKNRLTKGRELAKLARAEGHASFVRLDFRPITS